MDGSIRLYYETSEAVKITANYGEFEPTVDVEKVSKAEQWRRAYFELLSWKNTWSFPKVDLLSYRDHEAYVMVIVGTRNKDGVVEWMEGLGYKVKVETIPVATVEEPYGDEAKDQNGDYYWWFFE